MTRQVLFWVCLLGTFLPLLWVRVESRREPLRFVVPEPPPATPKEPFFREEFVPADPRTPWTHAPSLLLGRGGQLLVTWMAGSMERRRDVTEYLSVRGPEGWSEPRAVVDRTMVQKDLWRYVKTLGNPVLGRDPDGRLVLHFVSASLGGWSGAAINTMVSEDGGATWGPVRRLVTSPFTNVSTLVRGPAVAYDDDRRGLPVYHEFAGAFPELLELDAEGQVLAKHRMAWGRSWIQPAIVPLGERSAVALLRYFGRPPYHVYRTETEDGGKTWSPPTRTELPNAASGIAALSLGGERILLAHNSEVGEKGRKLDLSLSPDAGRSWRTVKTVASTQKSAEPVSYPSFVVGPQGLIHLAFNWHHKRIKVLSFNVAWLEGGG
jgi:predicted neuraminidase